MGKIFTEFPPVIFSSGTAHYSIKKAADLLGIGSSNAVLVNMDTNFRLDIADLKKKINIAISENKIPLAVIAIAGTTEEGAVDPIHNILDLRSEYEKNNKSFWLHIDSAWGGYISSLFHFDEEEKVNMKLNKIYQKLSNKELSDSSNHKEKMNLIIKELNKKLSASEEKESDKKNVDSFERKLRDIENKIENGNIDAMRFIDSLKKISLKDEVKNYISLTKEDFELNIIDRGDLVSAFVKDKVNFSLNENIREKEISWGGKPIISSFLAFKFADSITVDPHKLGYVPYPCGVIAFRNDRVRHFIMQRAPYITSAENNILLHNPPQHIDNIDFSNIEQPYKEYNAPIDAFAPFILEGSKPGAAAAALWFSSKIIPLNRKNHGVIIKESIIAARELHEWIFTWTKIYNNSGIQDDLRYEFKTFCSKPDTNVFVFALKGISNTTLKGMNELTTKVYENFSIQAERGSKKHSYSQSFFLSKTKMDEEHYKYDVFKNLFQKWGINMRTAKKEYETNGLIVLRATIMNPYIATMRRKTKQNLIKDFVWELHKCANEYASKI